MRASSVRKRHSIARADRDYRDRLLDANWLRTHLTWGYGLPSAELPELCRRTHPDPDDPIFNDYTGCASEWLKENDW